MSSRHGYAQTNLQLYNQLQERGFSRGDLALVRTSHDLAAREFRGLLRPNGKSFLAHAVGTASIAAVHNGDVFAIATAMLHALLSHGRLIHRYTRRVRIHLALPTILGNEVALRIRLYHRIHRYPVYRTENTLFELSTGAVRDALLVHLANALEDELDLGMTYCRKSQSAARRQEDLDEFARIARALDCVPLVEELRRARHAAETNPAPEELIAEHKKSYRL